MEADLIQEYLLYGIRFQGRTRVYDMPVAVPPNLTPEQYRTFIEGGQIFDRLVERFFEKSKFCRDPYEVVGYTVINAHTYKAYFPRTPLARYEIASSSPLTQAPPRKYRLHKPEDKS